jgi:hypothetical protein
MWCKHTHQLNYAAEAQVFDMVELKQEIEKIWNQKHCTSVQRLERQLAETKKQLEVSLFHNQNILKNT